MGQQGYTSCGGCGRLFRDGDAAEMKVLSTHWCSWDDDRLHEEIAAVSAQGISTPWRHQYR